MPSRRHRRRHKQRGAGKVELNLAAMLDMAFQLLAFFILTFRPAPVEGQLAMNLPPAVPTTKVEMDSTSSEGGGLASEVETLPLFIRADDTGEVTRITLGARDLVLGRLDQRNLGMLDSGLKQVFATPMIPFDRIEMSVDSRLKYDELMKIIDVATRQKGPDGKPMQKISFLELEP